MNWPLADSVRTIFALTLARRSVQLSRRSNEFIDESEPNQSKLLSACPSSARAMNFVLAAFEKWWGKYPPSFRPRRALNWVILGLMYAAYYMCRYNFRFATPGMVEEF